MAALDHSLTYQRFKLKNLPHRFRLKKIIQCISGLNAPVRRYVDVGCSNGYITNILKNRFGFPYVAGMDYTEENLNIAKARYPQISFSTINLNDPLPQNREKGFDLITCFETLEHVGNLEKAVTNLQQLSAPNGTIIITVPIEIGFWGTIKYLLKRIAYKGYTLNELGNNVDSREYFSALISGRNISKFREAGRPGWGTHFGFDYRTLDLILKTKGINFTADNHFTTRFYTINSAQN